jgi:hypothetical protein
LLYKAYLSYSHADEAWAKWLHRALESYRVPRALVGRTIDGREVPARLAPIFRDRDDLSSASNLGEGLEQALRDSEALILICSPTAGSSRWVNEEIRYFQALGRAGRIFCLVVDGDPGLAGGKGSPFPPALFDGVDDAPVEPLAADPRPFADGKTLARHKIIAGLLGVRLDELRQREHKRKRRLQAIGLAAGLAAAALAGIAISSRMAEQRERQSAEQMATFIVDLGEDLKSEINLEALGMISQQAMAYLEDIDPSKLSPETSIKVGLAMRQVGQVSEGQGRLKDAREAFYRSRALFAGLNERLPQRDDVLFELGQAEFYVAYHHFQIEEFELAWPPAERYAEISRQLYEADPEDQRWQLEMSYAATGLLAMRVSSSDELGAEVMQEADEALAAARQLQQSWPNEPEVISQYAGTLAWAADTRLLGCELDKALTERQETLLMAEKALQKAPSDNQVREDVAYANSGVARVSAKLGELQAAERRWRLSTDTIGALYSEDPSNNILREEYMLRRLRLAETLVMLGEVQEPAAILAQLAPEVALAVAAEGAVEESSDVGLDYQLVRAQLFELVGQREELRNSLRRALQHVEALRGRQGLTDGDLAQMVAAQYHWWRAFGEAPQPLALEPLRDGVLKSCELAIMYARHALLAGDKDWAAKELNYLHSKGYRGPAFTQICQQSSLCPP